MSAATLAKRHARWLVQIVGELELPRELGATCSDCAMCPPRGDYSPNTKCCTFLPQLPNFLVGALIREQPGRIEPFSIQLRTPMGLLARPDYKARYRDMVARGRFGREQGMRCPYYEPHAGTCGIWAFREAQCSTWFCTYDAGPTGRELWAALRDVLVSVEAALTLWCLRERGLDPQTSASDDAAAWGAWWGREAEFYVDCAQATDALDDAQLRSLLPPSAQPKRDTLLRVHARLHSD